MAATTGAEPLLPTDERSDEDTLSAPTLEERRRAALAVFDRPPSPEVEAMTEDEIMAFACAEVRAHRQERARREKAGAL